MAVTVRKKTLKLKQVGDAPPPPDPDEVSEGDVTASAAQSNVVMPGNAPRAAAGTNSGDIWAGILAIIGTVLLGALLALQFIENSGMRSVIPIR